MVGNLFMVSIHVLQIPVTSRSHEEIDAGAVNLSCSRLDHSEMSWMRRLAGALGMFSYFLATDGLNRFLFPGVKLAPTFSRHSTHLPCPTRKV